MPRGNGCHLAEDLDVEELKHTHKNRQVADVEELTSWQRLAPHLV